MTTAAGRATVRWPSGRTCQVELLRRGPLGAAYVRSEGLAARWVPGHWLVEVGGDVPATKG